MSDRVRERRHDRGMTLVEMLICVSLIGVVTAVISAAIIVVFTTTDSTEGRLNLARSEQSFTTWMPADLAAVNLDVAEDPDPDGNDPHLLVSGFDPVDDGAGAVPCGDGNLTCPAGYVVPGDNELTLRWRTLTTPGPTTIHTSVSYRVVTDGATPKLVRVECSGPVGGVASCSSITVLHELGADWSMTASAPTFDDEPDYESVAGQQVSVTINGGLGPDVAARAGGSDTVTLTAGGIDMSAISSTSPTGSPSFIREPSRCGGPIVLLVDDSNSIGTAAMATVRDAVRAFIDSFSGTPIQVQVIRFGTTAYVLGDGTTGNGYYDMSETSEVAALKAQITSTNLSGSSGSAGGTNWEDAWYRALVNDGKPGDQVTPNTVVFFTDGVPTFYNSGGSVAGPGNQFTRTGFDEAAAVAATFRRPTPPSIVGVGVNGPDNGLNNNHVWATSPTVYKTGRQILSQLVDGTDSGVPYDGSNAEQANLYLLNGFSGLNAALRTVALKDCGGTLTIRTRLATGGDGQKFGPEVVYENPTGDDSPTRTVATSGQFPAGTFDFELSTGTITTSVVPQISSNLSGYRLDHWECRAGPTELAETEVAIDGSTDFKGVELTLTANQATSCTMWIVPK